MQDDIRDIAEFYNSNPGLEHGRLERHQLEWLDLLYKISTEWSIIGASRHLLYIGKKQK